MLFCLQSSIIILLIEKRILTKKVYHDSYKQKFILCDLYKHDFYFYIEKIWIVDTIFLIRIIIRSFFHK